MVVGDQHHALAAVALKQRLQADEAREQVVEARTGDQLALHADARRRLDVEQRQLEVEQFDVTQAMLCRQPLLQQALQVGLFASWRKTGAIWVWALIARPLLTSRSR